MGDSPRFAFVVHPLVQWHRRVMGVRRGHLALALDRPAGIEAVGVSGRIWLPTPQGRAEGVIVAVPDVAEFLAADQRRTLAHQVRAAQIAREHGATTLGLGNALSVVAGRGVALSEQTPLPVTTGHAATAWAATSIAAQVLATNPGPVAVLGFKGTVGDAVAAGLSAVGHQVWVVASGKAAMRRAQKLGCHIGTLEEVTKRTRVVVGGATTGPMLHGTALLENTILVDLALPPTLYPGPTSAGCRIVGGETLLCPSRPEADFWGRIWLTMANYGHGCVFACLAEPMAMAFTQTSGWSQGRKLSLDNVAAMGAMLTSLGYVPVIRQR